MLFRLQSLNALYLIVCVLLSLVLMTQIKQIYDNNLKFDRQLGYKRFMNEISDNMADAERSVNKTSSFMHRLNEILLTEQMKKEQRSSLD